MKLCERGARHGFEPDQQDGYSVVLAPFEADPVCVWVAHKVPNSVILSPDGDLLVYPFANESPVCRSLFAFFKFFQLVRERDKAKSVGWIIVIIYTLYHVVTSRIYNLAN